MDFRTNSVIEEYLTEQLDIFTVDEFCRYLKSQGVKVTKADSKEILQVSDYTFSLVNNEYVTKAGVFTGRWFSFKPSREEVEKGSVDKKDNPGDGQPTYRDETRVNGNDRLGYVTIPGEWVILNNVISHEGIQYTDINNDYVVTLVIYENMTVDDFISLVKESLLKKGFVNLNVDKKTSNGTNLYQLYGYSEVEKAWILILCLPSVNGGVHCIELDGPDIESEFFEIPYTFRFTP